MADLDLFTAAGLCQICGDPPRDGRLRRGMCKKHYERWRVHGDPTVTHLAMPEVRGAPRHGTPSCYNSGCRCDGCKAAQSAYIKRWRVENKEKYRAGQKRWQLANPLTVKLSAWAAGQRYDGYPPSGETVDYARVLFGDLCSYCGGPAGAIDHVIALTQGGDGNWTNLTAACGPCNSAKHTKSLLHFMLGQVT